MAISSPPIYWCQAVAERLGIQPDCCSSCHSEMDARDEGLIDCDHSSGGELPDGTEFEEVCCGTTALVAKEGAYNGNEARRLIEHRYYRL